MAHKSAGFGVVGILAIVAVVALAGFGGWYVWQKQDKQNKDKAAAAQTTGEQQLSNDGTPNRPIIEETLSKTDADLRDVIIAKTKELAPTCVKDNQVVGNDGKPADPAVVVQTEADVDDEIGTLAVTSIGCDGGMAALFEKDKDGMWMLRETTQASFSCDTLASVAPSKKLMTTAGYPGTCLDENGKAQDIDSQHL